MRSVRRFDVNKIMWRPPGLAYQENGTIDFVSVVNLQTMILVEYLPGARGANAVRRIEAQHRDLTSTASLGGSRPGSNPGGAPYLSPKAISGLNLVALLSR